LYHLIMKKVLILTIVFLISCGPSEEEIQDRINEAVFQATSTTTTTTTTTTTLPTEECDIFLNAVSLIQKDIEDTQFELFDGEGYDERLEFYSSQIYELNILENFILQIEARTDNELDILYQLENYRFLTREFYGWQYRILYELRTGDDPYYEKANEVFDEAQLLGNQLRIRLNNYKCEN